VLLTNPGYQERSYELLSLRRAAGTIPVPVGSPATSVNVRNEAAFQNPRSTNVSRDF
jgi:hypothetical protein